MKKFAKMSLVAAVAVAGLTSTATAGSLEEAVKATTISGYVRVRFNKNAEAKTDTTNQAKLVVVLKSKVNDNVTSYIKAVETLDGANEALPIHQASFTYAADALSVTAGRTHYVSLLTDNGSAADGVVASYNAGMATITGAYFNNSKTQSSVFGTASNADVVVLDVVGSAGSVNYQASYATTGDSVDVNGTSADVASYKAYAVSLSTKIEDIGLSATYASKTTDNTGAAADTDDTWLDLGVSYSGAVNASLNYIRTDEEGGSAAIDNDTDGALNNGAQNIDLMEFADVSAIKASISAEVAPKTTLKLDHVNGEDATNDLIETRLTASYKMSSNFNSYVAYSAGEKSNADFKTVRVEIKYSF